MQAREIAGQVTNVSGDPLIGVSVRIEGKQAGCITDMDGRFSLTVADGDVLELSYVGYLKKRVKTDGRQFLEIRLEEDQELLEEIVVVGYGTKRRGSIAAAVSTIQSKDLARTTTSTLSGALVGKVAGVTSRQKSGTPGSGTSIQIRNFGTPLYVIDGIIKDEGQFNNLDVNDIENISVLKDGAAAIYGVKAANGVVLVTTKNGGKNQKCWLGTETGIFIYTFGAGFTGHLQKEYDVPYSLSDNAVHMLYLDREDGVWAGSFFGGLHYLSAHNDVFRRFIPRDSEGHIVGSVVREMVPDRKGNLYVGLENGGLCRFDVQTGRLAAVEDMLWGGKEFPDNVQSLLLDGDRLWIGTWNDGLFVYDVAEKRVTRHFYSFNAANHQPVRSVVSLLKASDGRLLAGTVNGLFLWQPGNQTFRRVMGHGFVHHSRHGAGAAAGEVAGRDEQCLVLSG